MAMRVSKQLNNNIVIATDDAGREIILMGKGIGFKSRVGSVPDRSLVEKEFLGLSSGEHTQQLIELLERIPTEHLSLGMEITEHVQDSIQKPLNETLVLLISDHVSFALERHRRGLELDNALLWEIKKFYPDEYKLGLDGLDIIERSTGVRLKDDEAGFLAMHIVNAQYGDGRPMADRMLALIEEIVNLVRLSYGIELDEDSLDYFRFITHLKFFLARILARQPRTGGDDLYDMVSRMYPKAAACAKRIATLIRRTLGYDLGEEEQGYLIIHIERLTR